MRRLSTDNLHKAFLCLFLCVLMGTGPAGCAGIDPNTRIVLTTGLREDEVFRIESISCSRPEIMVYVVNMQDQYQNIYGEQVWETDVDGETLETRVKENALARMAQVKTMNLMASSMDVGLSPSELKSAENAGKLYYGSLNDAEIAAMGVDQDVIVKLYKEYLLAGKVYREIIRDVNPEISDDEARNITIEYLLIRTHDVDAEGRKVAFDEKQRLEAYARAKEAYARAESGENFDTLVAEYSDSDEMVVSLGKSDLDDPYLNSVLFDLAGGELSQILTTDEGYMIALCLSTYNLEETDLNKERIVNERRESAFAEQYDDYVKGLTRKLNDALWEEVSFQHDPEVRTSDFFSIADEYLQLDK